MKYDLYGIKDIVYDSRKAAPDTAFVCVVGAASDGHDYAGMAYEKGSRLFFAQRELDLPDDAKVVICEDTRIALAEVSRRFFDYPDKKLKIIGITGTKGKTTTSNLVAQILNKCGKNTAVIGTNGIFINGEHTPTVNTTPESNELYRTFDKMVKSGCEYCVMEVSSQAVKLNRIHGISFEIGVFTNLSPDHISDIEHATYEEYRECKSKLFASCANSVINIDDSDAPYMLETAAGRVYTVSLEKGDFTAKNIRPFATSSMLGMSFECRHEDVSAELKMTTPGIYSVYNGMTAYAVCRILGIAPIMISRYLPECRVSGRFEIVDALPYATFIIDYAHNGVSLESVLETLRSYSPKRLTVLFGSVGERTQLRRKELAQAALKYADLAIVTSDNPGCEDPDAIIDEICSHLGDLPYVRFADRSEAIEYAVKNALEGDVILLAGKGHEDYQLIGKEKVPFCERELLLTYSGALQKL